MVAAAFSSLLKALPGQVGHGRHKPRCLPSQSPASKQSEGCFVPSTTSQGITLDPNQRQVGARSDWAPQGCSGNCSASPTRGWALPASLWLTTSTESCHRTHSHSDRDRVCPPRPRALAVLGWALLHRPGRLWAMASPRPPGDESQLEASTWWSDHSQARWGRAAANRRRVSEVVENSRRRERSHGGFCGGDSLQVLLTCPEGLP